MPLCQMKQKKKRTPRRQSWRTFFVVIFLCAHVLVFQVLTCPIIPALAVARALGLALATALDLDLDRDLKP